MRFKVDENLPIEVAELLRQSGYDAITIPQQQLGGSDDLEVISVCQQESRALITLDVDFADIRVYPPKDFPGLIVLRLRWQDKPHVLDVLARLIAAFLKEPLDKHLWIVEEDRIRSRE